MNITAIIAQELMAKAQQVTAAIELLDGGATVPFISRYRKEATGGLTDTQLRTLKDRVDYLRELAERQQTILKSINEQQKLTVDLEKAILATTNKSELEDLYLPYKPKRRTKAQIAKEAGLEPLAFLLLNDPSNQPELAAAAFIDAEKGVPLAADALEGARHILMELFAEQAELLSYFRRYLWENGTVTSRVIQGKEEAGRKFLDYFNYQEPIKNIPSHRMLALLRGQSEDFLSISLVLTDEAIAECIAYLCQTFNVCDRKRPADQWLLSTASLTWKIKLFLKLELETLTQLREQADAEAIQVFANNLHHLLMAAPAGMRRTLGLDPGLRTGVKAVVVDETGKLLAYETIFPHVPRNEWQSSIERLAMLCRQYAVQLVSIGNGTASRETDKLVSELKTAHPELNLTSVMVSEAGASVYSASELAAKEFPQLDVSYRGAVSIARRLQDPLAELVKIEPKSIGVGQYQHDVNQVKLSKTLRAVMEDCVNAVGVDVNTASIPLLACVAGINETIATNIVQLRDQQGPFKNRMALKAVPRLGEKAFEQAAGFLRITRGDNPLDASAVHPESYPVVQRILAKQKKAMNDIMGNTAFIKTLKPSDYMDDKTGLPTIIDILSELEKPGRDPRPEFKTAQFKEGIESIADLSPGMILEGVVTNVANFGAFVDIGVHQDGLVHISMLANHFVKDPNTVVKVGQIVKVKVLSIDHARQRIQLTMRLHEENAGVSTLNNQGTANKARRTTAAATFQSTTLGSLLQGALTKKK